MTFGSLFSGIGGIDLGLERAGMKCKWQVEIDEYARQVLEKHWPQVPKYRDVRFFLGSKKWRQAREAWQVDLIAGGFPCQDISNAGRRAGIEGKRSGLWSEFARIVRLLRPQYVFVENVPALTIRGLERVLSDLATLGYDAEWSCIPAAAVGAPHLRWRIFIVAYSKGKRERPISTRSRKDGERKTNIDGSCKGLVADTTSNGRISRRQDNATEGQRGRNTGGSNLNQNVSDSESRWAGQRWREQFAAFCEETRNLYWKGSQSPVCGVADGISHRLDRLRGLGNAVVPQIAEWIGRQLEAMKKEKE